MKENHSINKNSNDPACKICRLNRVNKLKTEILAQYGRNSNVLK